MTAPQEMCSEQYGEYAYWCFWVKGKPEVVKSLLSCFPVCELRCYYKYSAYNVTSEDSSHPDPPSNSYVFKSFFLGAIEDYCYNLATLKL